MQDWTATTRHWVTRKRSTKRSKQQTNKICSKKIDIKHAYSLPRGVAFYCKAQVTVSELEKEVDNIYPQSACSKSKSLGQYKKLVIKKYLSVSTEELNLSAKQIIDRKFLHPKILFF